MRLPIQDWGKMIGQKAKSNNGIIFTVDKIDLWSVVPIYSYDYDQDFSIEDCKPILRRLEDMTYHDKNDFCNDFDINGDIYNIRVFKDHIIYDYGDPECYKWSGSDAVLEFRIKHYDWLDSKGYDIRGWIDAGLAIDAKTLEV
jgi:hypothetical protein